MNQLTMLFTCLPLFSEISLKFGKLVGSQQVTSSADDHLDHVTLLYGGYLVVVLSFGLAASPDVLKWCEIIKNISSVPFLLPQQAIADVTVAMEKLFILYQHGLVSRIILIFWIPNH